MSDIIVPGDYGIGTLGFTPTSEGYDRAADQLVRLDSSGYYVDTSDYDVRRVMDYYGASDLNELRIKRRGW